MVDIGLHLSPHGESECREAALASGYLDPEGCPSHWSTHRDQSSIAPQRDLERNCKSGLKKSQSPFGVEAFLLSLLPFDF